MPTRTIHLDVIFIIFYTLKANRDEVESVPVMALKASLRCRQAMVGEKVGCNCGWNDEFQGQHSLE